MSDQVGSNGSALVRPARTVVILAVVAGLLLLGLLVLERSGSSPVQRLQNISNGKAAPATGGGTGGQGNAVAARSALPTLSNATISGAGQSQITDVTGNATSTCSQFVGGTGTTRSTVSYDTKGTTISKVTVPGAFFYWVSVSATSAGTQTFTVTQSTTYSPTTGTPLFNLQSEGSAFDTSCNPLATTETGGDASVTVTFNAPAAGTYVFAVEYMTHSVIGSSPAAGTYGYTFTTTGVGGSTQGVNLSHV